MRHLPAVRLLAPVLLTLCRTALASAAEEPASNDDATATVAEEGASLGFDVGVASAYMWRGANLWGRRTSTQHLSVFPGVTYENGGLSIFYWGAYQLTGEDKGANVDGAVGAEQDLGASYSISLTSQLSVMPFATLYLWPMATKAATDTSLPAAMEPGATLTYEASFASLGLSASYYRGLQDFTDAFSHGYLSPTVGRDIEFNETWTLNLAASAGYKLWTNSIGADANENDFDVQGNVGLTISFGDLYVKPAVHASWTNIEGDAVAAWGTVNVGYGLGL